MSESDVQDVIDALEGIAVGTRVVVDGVVDAPDFNGCKGVVTHAGREWHRVRLDGEDVSRFFQVGHLRVEDV